jgi:hypothetical protein
MCKSFGGLPEIVQFGQLFTPDQTLFCARDRTSPESPKLTARDLGENEAGGQPRRWIAEMGIQGPDRVDWPHDWQRFTSNLTIDL